MCFFKDLLSRTTLLSLVISELHYEMTDILAAG